MFFLCDGQGAVRQAILYADRFCSLREYLEKRCKTDSDNVDPHQLKYLCGQVVSEPDKFPNQRLLCWSAAT